METEKIKKQKQTIVKGGKQKHKNLSKAGQWFRDHPNGLEGFFVNDRRILYSLSPFDPDYHLPSK